METVASSVRDRNNKPLWKLVSEDRPLLFFRKTSRSPPAVKKIDPVPKYTETKIKEEPSSPDQGSEGIKLLALSIKKRRYVYAAADEDRVPMNEEQVEKVAFKRPRQTEAMSVAKSVDRKKRQRMEQQEVQPKRQEPPAAMMQAPHQQKTWLSVPGADEFQSRKSISDPNYWFRILQKNIDQCEDSKMLIDTDFTEEQKALLQKSFMHICRKMSQIMNNGDRFMKIHQCLQCHFSVSHQCISVDRVRQIPYGLELIGPSTLIPERTTICLCGFAFSHSHSKRLRNQGPTCTPRFSPYLREYHRSIDVSCAKCYTNIVMSNRDSDVCCDLVNWDSKSGSERQKFHTSLLKHLHYEPSNNFDEFYGCSKGCCLLFHRCPSNRVVTSTEGTLPG
ncbi:unnamed protein product [Leptosia nina]|uniref:Uncharacterized protein n=1 Tax=Leptosia nina TaxID=320188 RepID=A0AAV1J0U0_9NEOP